MVSKWKAAVALTALLTLVGFGSGLAVGYLRRSDPPTTVGLYACLEDLSRCTRLRWTPGLDECRAARLEYATAPVVAPSLVCIRRSAFVME